MPINSQFPDYFKFPDPYKDSIHVNTEIHFDWLDRIRILFRGVIEVRTNTLVENPPGLVKTDEINVIVYPIFPPRKAQGQAEKIEGSITDDAKNHRPS